MFDCSFWVKLLALRLCNNSCILTDVLKAILGNGSTFITYSIEMGHLMPDQLISRYVDCRPKFFKFSNIEKS